METIGFVGTGVMGGSMASHLMKAGYPLSVYTRTRSKADGLVRGGARWCSTVAELAQCSEIIITMVGFPKDVSEVYLETGGILENTSSGSVVIDMTTSRPLLAKEIAQAALKKGCMSLDAPVSGGDVGARNASLSIMVGGDRTTFDRVLPILERMGNAVYQGESGAGQHTKMSNQIAIASGMLGVCEALSYAEQAGLDPKTVLKSIGGGAAGSWGLTNLGPRILDGDYEPGFYVKHFVKDMRIALESAQELGISLPGLSLAKQLYDRLVALGYEEEGTQALYRLYKIQSETRV